MLEIGCTRLPAKLFWANVQYLGIVSVPVLWFVFGVQYSSWGHRPTRRQLVLLATIPMVTLLLVWTDPWHGLMRRNVRLIDPTPVIFTLSSIAAAWSLLRYGFLDIVPAARDTVIESLSDGFVVLDARNRMVDMNPAAQRIIGRASLQVIGKPVSEVLDARPDMVGGNCGEGGVRGELVMGMGQVRKLTGLLPMCAACKKIRDDTGYWQAVETYISEHSDAVFTHGICPDCMRKLSPSSLAQNKREAGAGLVRLPEGRLSLRSAAASRFSPRRA
jgi:PAS domain-containing protein